MPRVIGIDPGTITLDVCGLEDGRVFLDRSFPTSDALADPSVLVGLLESAAPLDLVAGPSGYGLPLIRAQDLSDADLRLAYLPDLSRSGGILGLRALMRALARSSVAVLLTPGVVHLPTVPAYRKVNRVDMGTADKVCAVALAVLDETRRRACDPREVSFILLELGGAFSAALAVDAGQIVDGLGGTSGPLGLRAAGALDGEVACLAGSVTKQHLFGGGVATIAGSPEADTERLAADTSARARIAWDAYLESAVKAVAGLSVSAPNAADVILSGRVAHIPRVHDELVRRIPVALPRARIRTLTGFGGTAKQGAQGAAVIADGLAGGRFAPIVDALGIRGATGTVLDYLYVISAADARARLKLDS
jgi:predicted butyrate kinase (DUF1464 family)